MEPRFRDILERMQLASVELNGLLIPESSIESSLARYVENLVTFNDDETYPVSLAGSATLISYRDHFFAVCTQHQLALHPKENFSLLSREGQYCVTSAGIKYLTHDNDWDYTQLAAFDFTAPCQSIPEMRKRFFRLVDQPPQGIASSSAFLIAAGFPFSDQKYDLEEKRNLHTARRIVVCQTTSQTSDPSLFTISAIVSSNSDLDGMSGGSVFDVRMFEDGARVYFAGIIVRGGKGYFHVIKAGYLKRFLNICTSAER